MSRLPWLPLVTVCAFSWLMAGTAWAGTTAFDKQMSAIYAEYAKIHQALANDSLAGVTGAARRIVALSAELDPATVTGEHASHYQGLPPKIARSAKALANASDLVSARAAFKDLSQPLAMWATMSRPPGVNVVYCSMAKGSWLQKGAAVMNPYEGSKMPHCGEIIAGPDKKGGDDQGGMQHGDGTMTH